MFFSLFPLFYFLLPMVASSPIASRYVFPPARLKTSRKFASTFLNHSRFACSSSDRDSATTVPLPSSGAHVHGPVTSAGFQGSIFPSTAPD